VGITSFFRPPPDAPSKPRIGGFSTAHSDEIAGLAPDLIITFSDVQAQLTAELMRRGFPVLGTNQRTLEEIEAALALLGRIVHREPESQELLREFRNGLAPVAGVKCRPRVYFEEWNEPLISGITWVSELIDRAGGDNIFPELQTKKSASERRVSPEEIIRRDPEIIFASWCGKAVRTSDIASRVNWNSITAVGNASLHEIPSEDILQPGFRLLRGYSQIIRHISEWRSARVGTARS
jgi:iron complex transport system substrate-binding protein